MNAIGQSKKMQVFTTGPSLKHNPEINDNLIYPIKNLYEPVEFILNRKREEHFEDLFSRSQLSFYLRDQNYVTILQEEKAGSTGSSRTFRLEWPANRSGSPGAMPAV